MRNIWIIAKREYNHYFISPLAYAVGFVILFILGFIFAVIIWSTGQQALYGYAGAPDLSAITYWFSILLWILVPALTMHLISDETRSGTIELLLTSPVRDYELIIGKWLGSLLFMLTIIAITLVYPLILNNLVSPGIDQQLVMSAYLGLILMAAAFLALGVGISAIFSNPIAALAVTFFTLFSLWLLIGIPANLVPGGGAAVFSYLDVKSHFNDTLNVGIINLSDLVYFFSLIALGLFMGTTAVEVRRWR
jgi:ABC-2 type transport system permease protein